MILKQRKSTEARKSMERDKRKITFKYLLPEIGCMALTELCIIIVTMLQKKAFDVTVSCVVMAVLGVAVTGFEYRRLFLLDKLDYDNGEHFYRFWICYLCGILVSVICIFLPYGGWPFLAVYVLLSLFSNMSTGMLAATSLMVIPVMCSQASANTFFLYFISGMFAVCLFRFTNNEFKTGIPVFLSLLCLFLCETANVVLPANARLNAELFVIPIANVIISCLLLVGILKLFSGMVVYKYRLRYLELNDNESPLFLEFKEKNKEEYMHMIHTTYFCERIALRLSFDVDALKCAGYYYKLGDKLKELLEEKQFPPKAEEILTEYGKKQYLSKETAVLLCAETVIGAVLLVHKKSQDKNIDYSQIIDAVFERFEDKKTFSKCDISIKELNMMHNIFKEEKLYYDFLR